MKNLIFLISACLIFTACGTQKRLQSALQKAATTKEIVVQENKTIDSLRDETLKKIESAGFDSSIGQEYARVLNMLNENLSSARQAATAIEMSARDKKNFRGSSYQSSVFNNILLLDSFNAKNNVRERIYTMLQEAITINSMNLFDLAAFFKPGIFKIPPDGIEKIRGSFSGIIDSMAYLSNKYSDIPHVGRIVFVGYADEGAVIEGSGLYRELSEILNKQSPTRQELNLILSDLRARELLRNMKIILPGNASKFSNFNKLRIGYGGIGKGEAYPSKTIKDYKPIDERRRIVLSYWAILPSSDALK